MTWGTPMTAETSISHKKMEFRGKKWQYHGIQYDILGI
jgi:hypothetical protein